MSVIPTPQPNYGTIPYLWTATQLISGGAGCILYYKEITYWKKYAAVFNTTLSAWSISPYKEWAFTALWMWVWASIGLLDLVLELLGQLKLFRLVTYASAVAPLGTSGGALWAYFSYKSSSLVNSSSYKFNMLDFYLTIGGSAFIFIIDIATIFELRKADTAATERIAVHTTSTTNENTTTENTTTPTNTPVTNCKNYVDSNGNWCDSSANSTENWGFLLL